MKKMQTLTVNGNTYQVSDSGAVSFAEPQQLTDEQKQQAKENLGIAGQYQLIEEVTLEEDATSFARAADPNGVPYDFSAIKVYMLLPACAGITSAKQGIISTKDAANKYVVYEWNNIVGPTERRTSFVAYNDGGLIECYTATAEKGGAANRMHRPHHVVDVWENACKLSISVSATGAVIPAGTQITIYAVRG